MIEHKNLTQRLREAVDNHPRIAVIANCLDELGLGFMHLYGATSLAYGLMQGDGQTASIGAGLLTASSVRYQISK
jgi:hypothetical protein